jgi:hypothetical protein
MRTSRPILAEHPALREHRPLFERAVLAAVRLDDQRVALDAPGDVADLGAVLAIERVGDAQDGRQRSSPCAISRERARKFSCSRLGGLLRW